MGRWSFCHKEKSGLADAYLALTGIRLVLGRPQWTESVPTEVVRLGVGSGSRLLGRPHPGCSSEGTSSAHERSGPCPVWAEPERAPHVPVGKSSLSWPHDGQLEGGGPGGGPRMAGGSGLGHLCYPGSSESQGPERGCQRANADSP